MILLSYYKRLTQARLLIYNQKVMLASNHMSIVCLYCMFYARNIEFYMTDNIAEHMLSYVYVYCLHSISFL